MKKILASILAITAVFSLFSCGKEEQKEENISPGMENIKLTGIDPYEETATEPYVVQEGNQTGYNEVVSEEYAIKRLGEYQDVPYTTFTESEWFEMFFEDFRSPNNPLQLSTGTFDDAVAVSPVRGAYFNGSDYVGATSDWEFPIVHENQCIGVITMSGKIDELGMPIGSSSESYAAVLNKAMEKGKAALFQVGNCYNYFVITEDNTVFNLGGEVEYKGDLTFEEVDKGYNVISADNFSTAVYPIV